jgi:protein TonB
VEVENRSAAAAQPRETDREAPRDEPVREPETRAVSNEPAPKEQPAVAPAPQDVATLVRPEVPVAPATHEPQQHEPPPPEAKPVERPHPQSQASPSPPASAANNIGRGRLAGDANYQGRIAAHLARYKRFPADARSRRQQGSAVVAFNIDGAGRVTSVRLVRGTGHPPLDHEVEAMVHRASPFPSPPDGTAMSFTAPVSFRLN